MAFPPGPMGGGYPGYAPGGPPPRGMGPAMMSQPISRPPVIRPNLPPGTLKNKGKLVPQEISDEKTKPPVTTVFIGSISDRAPDTMMRTLLQRCGNIISWKRVQGADGKLQAFGFCEFELPEATLRCIRLLNEWQIADKKLVAKVDEKTKNLLDEWEKTNPTDEESVNREDRLATAALEAVMREFAEELRRNAPKEEKATPVKKDEVPRERYKDEGLDDMPFEEDTKHLINREINKFRQAHQGEEVEIDNLPSEKERRSRREQRNERSNTASSSSESRRREDNSLRGRSGRDRDERGDSGVIYRSGPYRNDRVGGGGDRGDRHRSDRERDRDRDDRDSRKARGRSPPSRGRDEDSRRDRSRSPKAKRETEEEMEERYERQRLERQLRDKENAYQERLKNWEVRERKKIREFERERQRSEERKMEEKKEARRLREFLEDYDDEKDDPKFYRGHGFMRRQKEREKEAEADARDRQREKEELDALRKKLQEEGHPDPEREITKRQNAESQHQPSDKQQQSNMEADLDNDVNGFRAAAMKPIRNDLHARHDQTDSDNSRSNYQGMKLQSNSATVSPSDAASAKKKKLTVSDVFGDDSQPEIAKKKRPLVPLDYDEDRKRVAKNVEDKRTAIKKLIDRIPTDKTELFDWNMDWDQVDSHLLDNRIKPWVNKKITEYIGEEEPTLTDFICQKVMGKSSAQSILTDVAMVLDEEAEVFVQKMWRLLVYETEAKKAGLVK